MRGPVNTDEFIREVDEAVRQDRWLGLWKQYGNYVIGAALAIVIGSAAGVGWRNYQESQRLEQARQFAAAQELLRAGRPAEAAEAFTALAEEADDGYALLARFQAAQARAEAGDADAPATTLARLAEDGDAETAYRDLARLLEAQRALDAADPDTVMAELEPLIASDSPWRHSALELRALAQLRAGDNEAARQTLQGLVEDPTTPPGLARRASELLNALGGPTAANIAGTSDQQ